jgi:hypothetical protein
MNIIEEKYKYDGLIYNLYDDGTAEFVGTEINGSTIIPETISKGNTNYTVTSLNISKLSLLICIRIPKSVINIRIDDNLIFCEVLNCIEVHHDNTKFTTKDGVLFDKEITTLIKYPAGKPDAQYSIPNSVTTIGERAFEWCTNLNNIVIPNSVTTIGERAFYNCTNLNNIVIPNSVTTIGGSAFRDCENLNNIVIPNSVTTIGEGAFWGCKNLNNIVIPNSVTTIGESAFYNCKNRLTRKSPWIES